MKPDFAEIDEKGGEEEKRGKRVKKEEVIFRKIVVLDRDLKEVQSFLVIQDKNSNGILQRQILILTDLIFCNFTLDLGSGTLRYMMIHYYCNSQPILMHNIFYVSLHAKMSY